MAFPPSSPTILPLLLSTAALCSLLTPSVSADDRLDAGKSLNTGQSLTQGDYVFIMQQDCNLVLYDNGHAVWATGTDEQASDCVLDMQTNGNLVIYGNGVVIWGSDSNRQEGYYFLILQTDRNVVIYDSSNNPIWATGTNVVNADVFVFPHSNGTAAASGAAQNKVKELYP
ncbi:hypothetical protein KFK09_006644 [Dendrobium nobile]|uniref:Bulb-type lectin domain-containing protein n=1 Tax=Dendrobium nobile TaxID=94219 RepID=A0A8T3BPT8_DENNO|nr:hypothetical protein KFK09_006644 [Dendrobium nobile]